MRQVLEGDASMRLNGVFSFFALPIFILGFTGCSLGLFSDGRDPAVLKQPHYRQINSACAEINLKSAISVPQMRAILACLNSYGALDGFQKLSDAAKDSELQPLVNVLNRQFLEKPEVLFQFQETYRQWVNSGRLSKDLEALGALLSGALAPLPGLGNQKAKRGPIHGGVPADSKILSAARVLFAEFEPSDLAHWLGILAAVADSPSFVSLSRKFSGSPQSRASVILGGLRFLQLLRQPGRVELDRMVLQEISSGRIFEIMDDFSETYGEGGDLREAVEHLSSFFGQVSQDLPGLLMFFHGLREPIRCIRQTQSMPDPVLFALHELAERSHLDAERFLRRDTVLDAALMNAFCDYPNALSSHYGAYKKILLTDSIFTMAAFANSFTHRGAAVWLADFVAGKAARLPVTPLAELAPVLMELQKIDALPDLLLVLALVRPQDRPLLQRAATAWILPRPELEGSSFHDIFVDALMRATPESFDVLLHALGSLVEPVGLLALRHALFLTGDHPLIGSVRAFLDDPGLAAQFLGSLRALAARHPQEWINALTELREMSKSKDGRLADLTAAVLRMLSKTADKGRTQIRAARPGAPLERSALVEWRAHSLASSDLSLRWPRPLEPMLGCDQLTPWVRLDLYDAPGFESLVQAYLDCLGASGDSLQSLSVLKLGSGQLLLHQFIDSIRDFKAEPAYLDRAFRILFDGAGVARASALLDASVPWLSADTGRGTWIAAVVEALSKTWGGARSAFRKMEPKLAEVLRGDLLPGAISSVWEAWENRGPRIPFSDSEEFDLRPFQDVLRRYECLEDSASQRARIDELAADYRDSVMGWRLDPVTGRPPQRWDLEQLKSDLKQIFPHFADPARGHLPEGLSQFMRRFSNSAELSDWIALRANDWRVIPYFYPGEKAPRAKIVNSLDLLELLLINADFNFGSSQNYAFKFLTAIALAWGDEPRERWPAYIRAKYGNGRRPPTLAEAYSEILGTLEFSEKVIGYPKMPECSGERDRSGFFPAWLEARVFNMRQLVAVIEEGLPKNGLSLSGRAGGMRLLRNLLFDMYLSTPGTRVDHRHAAAGSQHAFFVAVRLAHMGVFRQISRGSRLALLPENQGAAEGRRIFDSVVEGLVAMVREPGSAELIRTALMGGEKEKDDVIQVLYRAVIHPEKGPLLRESLLYLTAIMKTPELADEVISFGGLLFGYARPEVFQTMSVWLDLLSLDSVRGGLGALQKRGAGVELSRLFGALPTAEAIDLFRASQKPEVKAAWQEVARRTQWLLAVRDQRSGILWGANPDSAVLPSSAVELLTSKELRQFLADQCDHQGPSEFLDALALDPQGFARLFEAIGNASRRGEIQELIKSFRRALPLTSDGPGSENGRHVHRHH
ncbi:MAG: hypothetical protein ACK5QT_01270 [Oligoflexia bacterium]